MRGPTEETLYLWVLAAWAVATLVWLGGEVWP